MSDIEFKNETLERLHKVVSLMFEAEVSFTVPDDQMEKTPEQVVRYIADEYQMKDIMGVFD